MHFDVSLMYKYRDRGRFSFGRGFKNMRRTAIGTTVEGTRKIKRSAEDANAQYYVHKMSNCILAQFQQSIHIHYWAFTQLLLSKRHCSAHNECDEEMNMESLAKHNQELQKEKPKQKT